MLTLFAFAARFICVQITSPVDFPLVGLDLSEFSVNPAHAGDLYDLFAVSNHMGGLGGGHYNAYVRNHSDGEWWLHDDSSVSRVRHVSDIKSSSAYVLFYSRRKRGAEVQTEEQIQAKMNSREAPNRYAYNTSSSSFTSSSSTMSELD
jgi:hypothetical protein